MALSGHRAILGLSILVAAICQAFAPAPLLLGLQASPPYLVRNLNLESADPVDHDSVQLGQVIGCFGLPSLDAPTFPSSYDLDSPLQQVLPSISFPIKIPINLDPVMWTSNRLPVF